MTSSDRLASLTWRWSVRPSGLVRMATTAGRLRQDVRLWRAPQRCKGVAHICIAGERRARAVSDGRRPADEKTHLPSRFAEPFYTSSPSQPPPAQPVVIAVGRRGLCGARALHHHPRSTRSVLWPSGRLFDGGGDCDFPASFSLILTHSQLSALSSEDPDIHLRLRLLIPTTLTLILLFISL